MQNNYFQQTIFLVALGGTYNYYSTGGHCNVEESENHGSIPKIKDALFALKTYCKNLWENPVLLEINTSSIYHCLDQ